MGFGAAWWFSGSASVPGAATVLRVLGVVVTLGLAAVLWAAVVAGLFDGTKKIALQQQNA